MGSVDEHISRDPASVSELSKSKQMGTLKYKSTISKSTLHDRGITKTVLKERAPTKEEMEKCEAWLDADEIEGAPFTWRDQRKLMKDREDEYIKKEVEMVNSSLRNWTTRDFNLGIQAMARFEMQKSCRDSDLTAKFARLADGEAGRVKETERTLAASESRRLEAEEALHVEREALRAEGAARGAELA